MALYGQNEGGLGRRRRSALISAMLPLAGAVAQAPPQGSQTAGPPPAPSVTGNAQLGTAATPTIVSPFARRTDLSSLAAPQPMPGSTVMPAPTGPQPMFRRRPLGLGRRRPGLVSGIKHLGGGGPAY